MCLCRILDPVVRSACCVCVPTPLMHSVKRLFFWPCTIALLWFAPVPVHAELISGLRCLQGLTEHVIAVIMRDVASALAYLHKDGIIHRDLKVGTGGLRDECLSSS